MDGRGLGAMPSSTPGVRAATSGDPPGRRPDSGANGNRIRKSRNPRWTTLRGRRFSGGSPASAATRNLTRCAAGCRRWSTWRSSCEARTAEEHAKATWECGNGHNIPYFMGFSLMYGVIPIRCEPNECVTTRPARLATASLDEAGHARVYTSVRPLKDLTGPRSVRWTILKPCEPARAAGTHPFLWCRALRHGTGSP